MAEQKETVGMDFLQSMPRRWVTVYIPLGVFVFVLLFPFYWMAMTSVKPNEELLSRDGNPFWLASVTLDH
ncbi:MAG: carbohydrate ABC transporter permease, partial [Gammaproteobacteria bacterium]